MERSLDALLDRGLPDRGLLDRGVPDRGVPGDARPGGDPARWQLVAQVLAALTSASESSELTGEARALAEFRAFAEAPAHGADFPPQAARRSPDRRRGRMTWLPGGRLAVAGATGAVLMCGLLAVAYAGDLPVAAQRLAHDTIHAPAVSPAPHPVASFRSTVPPGSAGRAGHRAAHESAGDRQVHGSFTAGHPHRHGSSGSPTGSSSGGPDSGRPSAGYPGSGRSGQSGPGRSSEPVPTPDPPPPASTSPPSDATPSPSAAPSPSQSGPPYPQQSPSSPQSTPP